MKLLYICLIFIFLVEQNSPCFVAKFLKPFPRFLYVPLILFALSNKVHRVLLLQIYYV